MNAEVRVARELVGVANILLTAGMGIGDKVSIANHRKYGFSVPWGWVKGFVFAKDTGMTLVPRYGIGPSPGSKVEFLEVNMPDPKNPYEEPSRNKTVKVPIKDVSEWGGTRNVYRNSQAAGEQMKKGFRFNADGITWEVAQVGATQSKARAVTQSERGKVRLFDNDVIEKQAVRRQAAAHSATFHFDAAMSVGKTVKVEVYSARDNRREVVDARVTDYVKAPGGDKVTFTYKGLKKPQTVGVNVFKSMMKRAQRRDSMKGAHDNRQVAAELMRIAELLTGARSKRRSGRRKW